MTNSIRALWLTAFAGHVHGPCHANTPVIARAAFSSDPTAFPDASVTSVHPPPPPLPPAISFRRYGIGMLISGVVFLIVAIVMTATVRARTPHLYLLVFTMRAVV